MSKCVIVATYIMLGLVVIVGRFVVQKIRSSRKMMLRRWHIEERF